MKATAYRYVLLKEPYIFKSAITGQEWTVYYEKRRKSEIPADYTTRDGSHFNPPPAPYKYKHQHNPVGVAVRVKSRRTRHWRFYKYRTVKG